MIITCPKNATHKKFTVTAHVAEEWVVDENGNYEATLDNGSGCVIHRPDPQDCYSCSECGTEAKVTS